MGSNSKGKKVYVETMKKIYTNIDDFNITYKTKFKSWKDLLLTEKWIEDIGPKNKNEKRDNKEFLLKCVDAYYKNAKKSFRKYNQNHLFLGDKINGNTNGLDSVIEITSKYTDLVNFQYYADLGDHIESMDSWSKKISIDQPILNGDSAFTVPTETMPNPFGPHCSHQQERADMTFEYMKNSLARKDFVGWHMCGIIDTIKTMPSKELNQHQGLMTITGSYYSEMEISVRNISDNLYKFAAINH